jgi:hypothetical protein
VPSNASRSRFSRLNAISFSFASSFHSEKP